MAFHVVYVAGGELDKVKRVEYVKEIKNFAQLPQPYIKMLMMNVPAVEGVYTIEWTSPNENMELLSLVVTCSGYGENDYYNLYVNHERWFDTWFPTEVKEGLYIGTAAYVYKLEPESEFTLKFVNMSGTAKKVWLGIRLLREKNVDSVINVDILDVSKMALPDSALGIHSDYYQELEAVTTTYESNTEGSNTYDITSTPLYQAIVDHYITLGYSEEEAKARAVDEYDDWIGTEIDPNVIETSEDSGNE